MSSYFAAACAASEELTIHVMLHAVLLIRRLLSKSRRPPHTPDYCRPTLRRGRRWTSCSRLRPSRSCGVSFTQQSPGLLLYSS